MEESMKQYAHEMEQGKLVQLILKFSIPCVIAMVVNALYITVDQIFIGRGVGYIGNAATNIAFPVEILAMGISLMIGDGAAAFYSIKLGEKNMKDAEKTAGTALSLFILCGLIIMAVTFVFMKNILWTFGATEHNFSYAYDYLKISIWGFPFFMCAAGFTSIIRADGNPQYSMAAISIGAIMNVILDPIFIFGFNMGIKGAAIATVIGELSSFLVCISYVKKFRNIKFRSKLLKIDFNIVKSIMFFGLSSFVTQLSVTILVVASNILLSRYGQQSVYGSDIPLSSMGIVMKVNEILMGVLIGIAVGGQPIVGYNYGAENLKRVKEVYLMLVKISSLAALIGFVVFQVFPQSIINLFGINNALYNEFALRSFRIFLLFCIFAGFEMTTSIFFQSIGQPIKSMILTVCKQILFIIPIMIILCRLTGVEGVLYAGPIAEVLSVVVTFIMILKELRKFK